MPMAIEDLPDYRTRLTSGAVAPLPSLDTLDPVSRSAASGARLAVEYAHAAFYQGSSVPERVGGAMLVFSDLAVTPVIEDPEYRINHPTHSLHQGLSIKLRERGFRVIWGGYVFEAPSDRYLFLIPNRRMTQEKEEAIAALTSPSGKLFDHTIVVGISADDALVFEHGTIKTEFKTEDDA